MDINEMTRHWGLEVDRVELTLGSLVKAPADGPCGSLIMPPSVPGLEGLTGPIQQLAMHFLGNSGSLQHKQGTHTHTHTHTHNCFFFKMCHLRWCFLIHQWLLLLRGLLNLYGWAQQRPSDSCGHSSVCWRTAGRGQAPALWNFSPSGWGLLPVQHKLRGWTASKLLCGFEPRWWLFISFWRCHNKKNIYIQIQLASEYKLN